MYILNICNDVSILGIILFIKKLLTIISYIVPAILVLLISVDFAKAVLANNDDDIKKAQRLAIKRIIAGLIVFFAPLIVETSFSLLGDKSTSWTSCYNNATDTVVEPLMEAEKEKLIQKEADRIALIEAAKKSSKALRAEKQKLRKKVSNKNQNSSSSTAANIPNKYVKAKKIAEAAGGGSNCSDGHKKNCPLGDQTGKEVRISKWRSSWTYILRPTDPVIANKAALCMENAANNNNIGYGQQGYSPWHGLWDYCKKRNDWDTSTVTKKVSVSCCPLVAVCLKYAGYNPSKSLNCVPNPSKMKAAVKKSGGFTEISDRNLTKIRRGDVLISGHHMAMAV